MEPGAVPTASSFQGNEDFHFLIKNCANKVAARPRCATPPQDPRTLRDARCAHGALCPLAPLPWHQTRRMPAADNSRQVMESPQNSKRGTGRAH